MKKNIKTKGSEAKIRTWNDTACHLCRKETGVKCLGNWRVQKPSECRVNYTNKPTRGDKGISNQKILKSAKDMEALIQSSY